VGDVGMFSTIASTNLAFDQVLSPSTLSIVDLEVLWLLEVEQVKALILALLIDEFKAIYKDMYREFAVRDSEYSMLHIEVLEETHGLQCSCACCEVWALKGHVTLQNQAHANHA
jgi:hypothetical protein